MRPWSLLVLPLALASCVTVIDAGDHAPAAPPTGPIGRTFEAPILAAQSGAEIGRATLTEGPAGVLIALSLAPGALTPGWHGVHFHQHGTCADTAAGFQASGAHVRHGAAGVHGLLNPDGPEAGDLPSVYAPAAGPIEAQLFSSFVTLSASPAGERMPLLDADGSAIVIHAAIDDQRTQPIGGAGARVACAAIAAR
ncbi:MAG: superoxide dismutase family protein [Alphaproteobacteria bacterium]|nr:superoxide dismutase family protein [Alphaproteobacteria bacterium]